jgi:hypothetical protein
MEPDVIRIKPHHFIDIVTALGRGQRQFPPHPYGHAVHSVAERLLDDRDAMLEMELGADDICRPCMHNVDGRCNDTIDTSFRPEAPASKREFNLLIDRRWGERLGLAQGDRLTAREFCHRLQGKADDLTDIYRENEKPHTLARQNALAAGVAVFLGLDEGE